VLLYSGLKGESPLKALREIIAGGPSALSAAAGAPAGSGGPVGVNGSGTLSGLAAAAQNFAGDKYSQIRRWQDGYSDCSSFVGKSLKLIGVTPPGGSVTGDYLAWSALSKVDPSQAQSGDLLVNAAHMVIVTGPDQAIGQENPTRNVATGSFASLMAGTGPYLCLRFTAQSTNLTKASQGGGHAAA
jgi:cell wall-associated NlpC family hydrolase